MKIRTFHEPDGTVHSGCTDPTQATRAFGYCNCSRTQRSGTVDNNFVKWKGTFRYDRQKWPGLSQWRLPSKVVPSIAVGPNRNGPFHSLISNWNVRNLGLNGKLPRFKITIVVRNKFRSWGSLRKETLATSLLSSLFEVYVSSSLVIRESPIFFRPHSKAILSRAIHNDTEFLAQQMVMDYSLLVGIDEARSELIIGIIGESERTNWLLSS